MLGVPIAETVFEPPDDRVVCPRRRPLVWVVFAFCSQSESTSWCAPRRPDGWTSRELDDFCGQVWVMNDATTAERDRGVWSDPRAADLYASHVDALHAYVARRVGRDVAADVVAEAFRIAIEDLGRYDAARGSQRAWLFGIATNLLRRHWRTETRRLTAMSRYGATRVPGR